MSMARRTSVQILFEGADITTSIMPYLLSLTYTDSEEDESDSLQIKLQDRGNLWLEHWMERAVLATAASRFSMKAFILQSGGGGEPAVVTITQAAAGSSGSGGGGTPKAGDPVSLSNTPVYYTSTSKDPSTHMNGTYYYYDGTPINGRYRITNTKQRCGKQPVGENVTGWIDAGSGGGSGCGTVAAPVFGSAVGTVVGGALPTGKFELDSVEADGPPYTVILKGSSLPYGSPIRQTKKTKAWENYKLSGIAKEIAGNAGMKCLYESEKDPTYKRKEQTKKSDITFLSELCHDAGISLKCSDGQIILFDQAKYEALPPVMAIVRGGGAYENYTLTTGAAETQYGSCRVSYTDPATGKKFEGIAKAEGEDGESEQRLEITAKVESDAEAKELAEMNLRLHNKFNRMASFTLPGNTALVAGVNVLLIGFGGWTGKYMIKQATHTVGGSYKTKIDLRKILPPPEKKKEEKKEQDGKGQKTYTVKPGDNLWDIAKKQYGSGASYEKIYEANKGVIGGNPNLIYPGQTLTIP